MIYHLPDEIFSSSNSSLAKQAALDSFYVNVRLLIEFLEVRSAGNDKSATTVTPNWSIAHLSQQQHADLNEYHRLTSKHVVHFTTRRLELIQPSETDIRKVSADVLAVWGDFAELSNNYVVAKLKDLPDFGL